MKPTRTFMLALAASWAGACFGAAPATPSYVAIEATIARVESDWKKPGAEPGPHAAGWSALFDGIRRDLAAYAAAKTEDERLIVLGRLDRVSNVLQAETWPPAVEVRDELREWLRPRVSLAWAERRLVEAIRGLPATADAATQANRQGWIQFVSQSVGSTLQEYESAGQVRQKREALAKVHGTLEVLQHRNQAQAWEPSKALQVAIAGLYDRPNLQATADSTAVAPRLANFVVESGPVVRDGQVSYVTAGPYMGFGLLASDDGIVFFNRQALSSVTPINGFQQQVASDPKGKTAAKLYQFQATSADQSVLTVIAVLRPTGLELFPESTHATDATVSSAPQPGKGLGRAFAAMLGLGERKIEQKVYEGAIGQIRAGVVQGSREEAAEKSAAKAAETNAMLANVFIGGDRLAVKNFEVDDLKLRSRPEFVIVDGKVRWRGASEQVGADSPRPSKLNASSPGITADVHLASIATNLTRGYLQGDQARSTTNLMVITKKIAPGAPPAEGVEVSRSVDYPTFLKAVEAAQAANDPKVMAVRVKKPGRSPEFSVDRNGFLVATVHDFQLEVPAPESARKGGFAGPPARVYRIEAPEAELSLSFRVEPAKDNVPIKLAGRIEGFDPGPNAKVFALNEEEEKAVPLPAFQNTIVLNVFASKLKGQPIDVPLGSLPLPGYAITSVSDLDPSGWLRVVLSPTGEKAPAPAAAAAPVASLPNVIGD